MAVDPDPDPYGYVYFVSLIWILIHVTCAGPDPVPGDGFLLN